MENKKWKEIVTKRRVGIFRIPADILDNFPLFARSILEDKLIVEAVFKYAYHAIEYTAYCDAFDETPNCQKPPYYDLQFAYGEIKVDGELIQGLPCDWSLVRTNL